MALRGSTQLGYYDNAGGKRFLGIDHSITPGGWEYVAVVGSGTKSDFFVGTRDSTPVFVGSAPANSRGQSPFRIGYPSQPPGDVAMVLQFARALTPAEIVQLYQETHLDSSCRGVDSLGIPASAPWIQVANIASNVKLYEDNFIDGLNEERGAGSWIVPCDDARFSSRNFMFRIDMGAGSRKLVDYFRPAGSGEDTSFCDVLRIASGNWEWTPFLGDEWIAPAYNIDSVHMGGSPSSWRYAGKQPLETLLVSHCSNDHVILLF